MRTINFLEITFPGQKIPDRQVWIQLDKKVIGGVSYDQFDMEFIEWLHEGHRPISVPKPKLCHFERLHSMNRSIHLSCLTRQIEMRRNAFKVLRINWNFVGL